MSTNDHTKPLGLVELLTGIGDEKIRFQRLGQGHFRANVNTKDCKMTFATEREVGLEIGAGETIGLVVWLKQSDCDAVMAARNGGAA